MVTKSKPVSHDFYNRQALLDYNKCDQETIDKAIDIKDQAMRSLVLTASPLIGYLQNRIPFQLPTMAIDTFAVSTGADSVLVMMFNPEFTIDIDIRGTTWALYHELGHIMFRHLCFVPGLSTDPVYKIAEEYIIQNWVGLRLAAASGNGGTAHSPLSPYTYETKDVDRNGKPITGIVGIDPKDGYKEYTKDLRKQGLTPVSYDTFVSSEMMCFSELMRMSNPPSTEKPKYQSCIHNKASSGDGNNENLPTDQDTIDDAASFALQSVIADAIKGNAKARAEIMSLAECTEFNNERASQAWGNVGLGVLRGETNATRLVTYWQQHIKDVVGSKLQEGARLIYPRKRGAILQSLGFMTPLLHRGKERQRNIGIFFDTSGSMPDSIIPELAKLVGDIPNVTAHYACFDSCVMPFKPGDPLRGNGGTSFQAVVDYVEGRTEIDGETMDEELDAYLVVTDGYASPVRPEHPAKWTWLVTPGGNMWMAQETSQNPAMSCVEVDLPGQLSSVE